MFRVFEVQYFGVHSKTNVQEAAAGSKATDDQSSMCFFYSDSRNHVITHYILLLADLQHHVQSTFHGLYTIYKKFTIYNLCHQLTNVGSRI